MADLAARYQALPADEQRILQVLSVICEPVGQTQLQQVLAALGWHGDDAVPLSLMMCKPLRERLLADGLLVQTRNSLTCPPELLDPLTRQTVTDGIFADIVAAAERLIPTQPRTSWERPSDERRLRMLRNALYAGEEKQALAVLGLTGAEPAGRVAFHRVEPLTLVCIHSADPAWLERLGPRIKILALVPLMRAATLDLVADPDTYALVERLLLPLTAAHPDAAEALAEQRLLRGRVDQVPQLLAGRDDPEALALRTWLHCLQGDYAQAIVCCETIGASKMS